MISGESGSGKTETCFELEKLGFRFLADDAVELLTDGSAIFGRPIKATAGIAHRKTFGFVAIKSDIEPVHVRCEMLIDETYPFSHFLMGQSDIVHRRIEKCAAFRAAEQIHTLVKGLV